MCTEVPDWELEAGFNLAGTANAFVHLLYVILLPGFSVALISFTLSPSCGDGSVVKRMSGDQSALSRH